MDENVITILCMDEKRACEFSLGMVMFGNKGAFFCNFAKEKDFFEEKPAFQCTLWSVYSAKILNFCPKK
jgi:hypothetical protein